MTDENSKSEDGKRTWIEVCIIGVCLLSENELVTPPLDQGIILPGVTRTSLIDLARGWVSQQSNHQTIRQLDTRMCEYFFA